MAKTVSLKLDDPTYWIAEKIRKHLNLPRSTYFRTGPKSLSGNIKRDYKVFGA